MASPVPSRPLGPVVPNHQPAPVPSSTTLRGEHITLTRLLPSHAASLFPLLSGAANAPLWDYMFAGPFSSDDADVFASHIATCSASHDPLYFAIVSNTSQKPVGMISLMRIDAANRVLEVGNIMYAPPLQRTPGASEVMYLLGRHVFEELEYRRWEWKCHACNAPSRRAAARYGFVHEGVFRKHMVIKGRSRDTWWASMVDEEWEVAKKGFEAWLDQRNFNDEGRQKKTLEECRSEGSR